MILMRILGVNWLEKKVLRNKEKGNVNRHAFIHFIHIYSRTKNIFLNLSTKTKMLLFGTIIVLLEERPF